MSSLPAWALKYREHTCNESELFLNALSIAWSALERINEGENLPGYGDDDGSEMMIAKEAMRRIEAAGK